MQNRRTSLIALSGAFCSLAAASVATSVRADVTIVSKTTTSGGMMPGMGRPGAASSTPTTATATIYYKGHKMRTETQGTVVLFDGDANKTYILDPAKKTYISVGDMSANNPFLAMMKMDTSATVKPTGATRTIAGHVAREYTYTSNIDMTMDTSMMASMGGAPPKPGAKPMGPQHVGSVHSEGSWWVTNIASLPGGGSGAVKAASAQVSSMMPGMKQLLDKFSSIPGVPIASHESTTIDMAMMRAPAGSAKRPPSVRTSDATSVREAPLPDSLFALPAGYKQVDPLQGMGKMGGARRGGMTPAQ